MGDGDTDTCKGLGFNGKLKSLGRGRKVPWKSLALGFGLLKPNEKKKMIMTASHDGK